MRYPEKKTDDPSHQHASYPINYTNNRQRRQRTDVVRTKRRNNMGEEKARHSHILPIKMKTISHAAHRHSGLSYQYELRTAACSFCGEEIRLVQHKPCTNRQKTRK